MSNVYLIVEVDERLLKNLREVIHSSGLAVADVPVHPKKHSFYMDTRVNAFDSYRRVVQGCKEMSEYMRWAKIKQKEITEEMNILWKLPNNTTNQ